MFENNLKNVKMFIILRAGNQHLNCPRGTQLHVYKIQHIGCKKWK